ncbi:hypothetical protein [Paenibacillus sp. P46E]|uniref:hypothetical protein n=1 Tax=Paenibacillus sp. P46E TaxID=1349436 RepID=UPI00093E218F|nr:hypothetical protein [Paenibacillus sp. P46E]OKP95633.1 hypothetical protein A3849_24900 [Paenibacillus sp. P46E]
MKRIFVLLLLSTIVWISGCSGKHNIYDGIDKQDIKDIETAKDLNFIYSYKGHTDNWVSTYYVYQLKKDSDNHITRLFLKYIGKKPGPSGEMKYEYSTEGGHKGSGTLSDATSPSFIYNLGSSGGNGSIADQDSVVKMQVEWNGGKEEIKLLPELQ